MVSESSGPVLARLAATALHLLEPALLVRLAVVVFVWEPSLARRERAPPGSPLASSWLRRMCLVPI